MHPHHVWYCIQSQQAMLYKQYDWASPPRRHISTRQPAVYISPICKTVRMQAWVSTRSRTRTPHHKKCTTSHSSRPQRHANTLRHTSNTHQRTSPRRHIRQKKHRHRNRHSLHAQQPAPRRRAQVCRRNTRGLYGRKHGHRSSKSADALNPSQPQNPSHTTQHLHGPTTRKHGTLCQTNKVQAKHRRPRPASRRLPEQLPPRTHVISIHPKHRHQHTRAAISKDHPA